MGQSILHSTSIPPRNGKSTNGMAPQNFLSAQYTSGTSIAFFELPFLARLLDDPAGGLVELGIVLRQPLLGVEDRDADLVQVGIGRMHQDVEVACPVVGLHGRIFPHRFSISRSRFS